jgi:hypothetical protein
MYCTKYSSLQKTYALSCGSAIHQIPDSVHIEKKNKYISPNILHVLCHYQKCMLYSCEQFLNWFKVVLELIHDNSWTNSIQVLESITIVLELIPYILELVLELLELFKCNSWTILRSVLEQCLNSSQGK